MPVCIVGVKRSAMIEWQPGAGGGRFSGFLDRHRPGYNRISGRLESAGLLVEWEQWTISSFT